MMINIGRGLSGFLARVAFNNTGTSAACLTRSLHTTRALNCDAHKKTEETVAAEESSPSVDEKRELSPQELKLLRRDRTKQIPVETSIRYLNSSAYKQTYGEHRVWEQYRRNHKGLFPPRKTRKTCIRRGSVSTGNPCPICRDEYLVLDHRNINLLQQFISPQTGEVLSYSKTGLCQKKHLELLVAVERARDYGLLTFDVPYREFDYSEFYGKKAQN